MICKQCKSEPVPSNRKVFCSERCGFSFHSLKLRAKKKLEVINDLSILKATVETYVYKVTEMDKEETIAIGMIDYTPRQRTAFSTIIRAYELTSHFSKYRIKRIDGTYRTYKSIATNLNQLEELIKMYHDKYNETFNMMFKNSKNNYTSMWYKLNTYLEKQHELSKTT